MDNQPPAKRRRGRKAAGEPRLSRRARNLPEATREHLVSIAYYLDTLKHATGLDRDRPELARRVAQVTGSVALATVSEMASVEAMSRKGDINYLILLGMLRALGSSLQDLGRALEGETTADEWELLAFYRMLSDEDRDATRAQLRIRATGSRRTPPTQPSAPLDSGEFPTSPSEVSEHLRQIAAEDTRHRKRDA